MSNIGRPQRAGEAIPEKLPVPAKRTEPTPVPEKERELQPTP